MEYHLLEDGQFTTLSSTGDQEALVALCDRYSSRVFSMAMVLLGDRSHAEEVTQDVFLSVWRNSGSFDPLKARFSTWITHIAHNRAVDELRKRRKRAKAPPWRTSPRWTSLSPRTPLPWKRAWSLPG